MLRKFSNYFFLFGLDPKKYHTDALKIKMLRDIKCKTLGNKGFNIVTIYSKGSLYVDQRDKG